MMSTSPEPELLPLSNSKRYPAFPEHVEERAIIQATTEGVEERAISQATKWILEVPLHKMVGVAEGRVIICLMKVFEADQGHVRSRARPRIRSRKRTRAQTIRRRRCTSGSAARHQADTWTDVTRVQSRSDAEEVSQTSIETATTIPIDIVRVHDATSTDMLDGETTTDTDLRETATEIVAGSTMTAAWEEVEEVVVAMMAIRMLL